MLRRLAITDAYPFVVEVGADQQNEVAGSLEMFQGRHYSIQQHDVQRYRQLHAVPVNHVLRECPHASDSVNRRASLPEAVLAFVPTR